MMPHDVIRWQHPTMYFTMFFLVMSCPQTSFMVFLITMMPLPRYHWQLSPPPSRINEVFTLFIRVINLTFLNMNFVISCPTPSTYRYPKFFNVFLRLQCVVSICECPHLFLNIKTSKISSRLFVVLSSLYYSKGATCFVFCLLLRFRHQQLNYPQWTTRRSSNVTPHHPADHELFCDVFLDVVFCS